MQNKAHGINIYGALGSALLVSILIVGLVLLVTSTTPVFRPASPDGSGIFLAFSFLGLLVVLFGVLPILLTSRYGWKTVLASFLIQAVLIFSALLVITLVTNNQSSDKCYATSSAARETAIGPAIAPDVCY